MGLGLHTHLCWTKKKSASRHHCAVVWIDTRVWCTSKTPDTHWLRHVNFFQVVIDPTSTYKFNSDLNVWYYFAWKRKNSLLIHKFKVWCPNVCSHQSFYKCLHNTLEMFFFSSGFQLTGVYSNYLITGTSRGMYFWVDTNHWCNTREHAHLSVIQDCHCPRSTTIWDSTSGNSVH